MDARPTPDPGSPEHTAGPRSAAGEDRLLADGVETRTQTVDRSGDATLPAGPTAGAAEAEATASDASETLDLSPTPDPDAHPSDIDPISVDTGAAQSSFAVVGIGASAGGLKAFQEFFDALPEDVGMAFVLVQHLSPDHESALAEIVQKRTSMSVSQVNDHPRVEPNRVYVIPPDRFIEMTDGHLQVVPRPQTGARPVAIDHFLRSLAKAVGERAVAMVLSGTGSDGSLGLKAVKEAGGLTMAQDPDSAEHGGMPRSAIATELVDVVGTPETLAARLVGFRRSASLLRLPHAEDRVPEADEDALRSIFSVLRQRTGHDFTHYKRSTILRRLARRLQVAEVGSLSAYAAHLRTSPDESLALLRDFLISVTQFFRDPDAFRSLERLALPALRTTPRGQLRVWVPGCATGEEAYTQAMLLCEAADGLDPRPDIQVFATDIDEQALAFARQGVYPDVVAGDLSPERLARFFERVAGGYRVRPEIREVVLFASHNLISDPPFSRLDIISCRNVLIYMNREVQDRVLRSFHYALRTDGYLFLGTAETPSTLPEAFAEVDKHAHLYRKRDVSVGAPTPSLVHPDLTRRPPSVRRPGRAAADPEPAAEPSFLERYRDWTLARYAPPRLLVDARYDVTHVFGRAGDYLRDREGPVTQNVVEKVVKTFQVDLRTALFRAFSHGEIVETPFRRFDVGGDVRVVRLHVGPVGGAAADAGLSEVVFVELDVESVLALDGSVAGEGEENLAVTRLEEELRETRRRLETTIEEQEASNEELTASNEELQSINEELQLTTEELETSKEELQSVNEELTTVNHELKVRLDDLTRSNSDLVNLMAATDVGTLFVDRRLCLTRYTPAAAELFSLLPADVGRPLAHLAHRLLEIDLVARVQGVLDALTPTEQTVTSAAHRQYLFRASPYRTLDDRIDGAVLTFVDVTELEQAKSQAAARADQQQTVAEIGALALEGKGLMSLFELAVARVRDELGADACKVLAYEPEHHRLRLAAGVGWTEGAIGEATVPDDVLSQAGYTLVTRGSVLVDDLEAETRFKAPPLLLDHGLRSGMSVVIPSVEGDTPFGVLGVHCADCRRWSEEDGRFLSAVANVLAESVGRHTREARIETQLSQIQAYYDAVPVGIAVIDRAGQFVRVNHLLAELFGLLPEEIVGQQASALNPDYVTVHHPHVARVLHTGLPIRNVPVSWAGADGEPQTDWLVNYHPVADSQGAAAVSLVVQDVTPLTRTQRALERLAEELEERVAERTAQVQRLAIDLTDAEQRERGRIAQILHDDVQQLLYAVEIKTQLVRQLAPPGQDPRLTQVHGVLGDIEAIVEQAVHATRTLAVDLSPPVLEGEGLARSLAWLVPRVKEAYGLDAELVTDSEGLLDTAVHSLVFQSVRELLFNVVKHASVTHATIHVMSTDAEVCVTVGDHGLGFDPGLLQDQGGKRSGLGLFSVRERLKLIGGRLEITSTAGEGTKVCICVPRAHLAGA